MERLVSLSVLCLLLVSLSWEVGAFSEAYVKRLKQLGH